MFLEQNILTNDKQLLPLRWRFWNTVY